MFVLFRPKTIFAAQMASNALFPTRLSEEEILANPAYTTYVVLNIPQHGQNVPFDTVGRTTFKKFILKSYADFYDSGALKTSNFKSVPFVISKTPTVARVVYVPNKRQAPEANTANNNSKKNKVVSPQKPNQNQNQIKQVHPPPKPVPKPAPSPQIQLAPVQNLLAPTLTIDMSNDDGDYYAQSHCKWNFLILSMEIIITDHFVL